MIKTVLAKAFSGSERTRVVKKNIAGSFLIKGLSMATSLYLVPFTIDLLDQEKYGIWITIYSIVTWLEMMDIGLGNGFRNKFAEAIARNEKYLAKEYIQTLYSSMGLISLLLLLVYTLVHSYIPWYRILNIKNNFDENIQRIIWWVFALFCLQLFLKNVSTILLALQKTSFSNSLLFIANFSSLLLIYFLEKMKMTSLFTISIAFMITPVIVYIVVTVHLFRTTLKEYVPRLTLVPPKTYLKDLVGLGVKFFFIQITTIVMFSADNLIITQLFGPKDVTPYNIAYRLFSSTLTFLTIINIPFWSAFTEANAKNDHAWIIRSMDKLIKVWAVFSIGIILLWTISPFIIGIWIGHKIIIPYNLTLQFAIFSILMGWLNPFVLYISGVGKIKLELWIAAVQLILAVPVSVLLAKQLHFGISGVIMGTNVMLLIPALLIPVQYYKLINGKATGIWKQ